MPQLENNLTDDPIALDGDVSFSGGQASNVRKNVIAEGAFDIGKNVDFDTFGNATTRRGVAQLLGDSIDTTWSTGAALTDTWTASPATTTEFSALKWSATLVGPILKIAYYDVPEDEQIILANYDTDADTRSIKDSKNDS